MEGADDHEELADEARTCRAAPRSRAPNSTMSAANFGIVLITPP